MLTKLVTAAASAALCLASAAPAFAQQYQYSGFNAPMGATATANIRIPLGAESRRQPSYGLSFGLGRAVGAGFDGRPVTREMRLADLRFSGDGRLARARVASFDLANPGRDRRLSMMGDGDSTLWIVGGLVAAGVAACLAFECFEGDDEAIPNN